MTVYGLKGEDRVKFSFDTDRYFRITNKAESKERDCPYCLHFVGKTAKGEAVCRESNCPALLYGYDVASIQLTGERVNTGTQPLVA